MNNGLGRWNLLIFKCFRFSDGGWCGMGGGGVTCLYSWRGRGGVEVGGKKSVDPNNITGSPPFPAHSV